MRGVYTRFPDDLTQKVQMNAGIICKTFDPETGEADELLGATSSGITFNPNPTYEDFGADIDNVPANTYQLKRVVSYDPSASGSFRTMTAALMGELSGAGDFDAEDTAHYVPSHALKTSDFVDVWIIGDYSEKNVGAGAGFIAIHLMHALNTTGFQWKTNKDGKGEFAFDYHGHYDLSAPDTVPFEVYVKAGTSGEADDDTDDDTDGNG